MGFVPVEKLTKVISNPYEAILVAAKDARIQNSIQALKDLDPTLEHPKVTTISLYRVIDGKVDYYYAPGEEPERPGVIKPAGGEKSDA